MKKYLFLMLVLLAGTTLLNAKANIAFKPEQIIFDTLSREDPIKIFNIQMSNLDEIEHKIRGYTFLPNVNGELSSDLREGASVKARGVYKFKIKLNPAKAEVGEFVSKMIIFIDDSTEEVWCKISGYISSAPPAKLFMEVYVPEIRAEIGEDFTLPVIIRKIEYKGARFNYIKGMIKYNSSILAPASGGEEDKVEYGIRWTVFERRLEGTLTAGDTIASIAMIPALGDATSTKVQLSNVKLYYENEPVEAEMSLIAGSVSLDGIVYQEGLPRLVSRMSSNYYIFPPPNPVTEDIMLEVIYIGRALLKIYSVNGILVRDYSSELPVKAEKGNETIDIPRGIFPTNGAYIIRLSGENEFVSKMIIVK